MSFGVYTSVTAKMLLFASPGPNPTGAGKHAGKIPAGLTGLVVRTVHLGRFRGRGQSRDTASENNRIESFPASSRNWPQVDFCVIVSSLRLIDQILYLYTKLLFS